MSQTFPVYDFNETQIKPMMSQSTHDKEILLDVINEIKGNQISIISEMAKLSNLCIQINKDIVEIKEKLIPDFEPILIDNSDIEQTENEQNENPPPENFNSVMGFKMIYDENKYTESPTVDEVNAYFTQFKSAFHNTLRDSIFEVSAESEPLRLEEVSNEVPESEPPPLEEVFEVPVEVLTEDVEVPTEVPESGQNEPVKPKRIYNRRKK